MRIGDDVVMSGGKTQKLSDVKFFNRECHVYEFMFEPDVPVESFPVPPASILTHGRGIRRSHKRASLNKFEASSMPDTEWEFAEYA